MENAISSEFVNQLGGSSAANLIFGLGFILVMYCRSKCRTSNCSGDLGICKWDSHMEDLKNELTTTQRDQKSLLLQIAKKLKSGPPGNIV
jgi:hypothetical protein